MVRFTLSDEIRSIPHKVAIVYIIDDTKSET
jgi:hypothetical protein